LARTSLRTRLDRAFRHPAEGFAGLCCGSCIAVIPSYFRNSEWRSCGDAALHWIFRTGPASLLASQTLVAVRYDIVTAADNWVSVVTNGVAALPGLPASGLTETPAS
jgi:hypothetical protein